MALSYKTVEGDRIDLIVLNHYGDLEMLKEVIDANPHLTKTPLSLQAGVDIQLPDAKVVEDITNTIEAGDALW